jgi:hypothetical protein
MGLLDMLGGNRAQMPGQSRGGFGQLLDPSVALPMAAALMGNQGNMANIGNAFGQAGPALAQTRERNDADQQQNRTYQWLQQNAPEYAQLMDGGLDGQSALEMYARQRYAQTADRDPYKAVGGHIFNTDTQEWSAPPNDGAPKVGLNPVLMQNEDGSYSYVQPNSAGEFVQTKTPEGLRPVGPYDKAFQTKSGGTAGAEQGEAKALYDSMTSKMPGLEYTVKELETLADQATYTTGGQLWDEVAKQTGQMPRDAAVARAKYIAVVDNQVLPLLRDTFGSQFTVTEGQSLRATLGDPNKTPQEKKAVLRAFIEQKRRNIEALAVQTGQQQAPQSGGGMPDFSTMSDEELEGLANGQ